MRQGVYLPGILKAGVIVLLCVLSACAYDMIESPEASPCMIEYAYDTNIKTIIDQNCAYSGCHDGASGAPGNFSSFDGLQGSLDNGRFFNRVIDTRDMPPDYAAGPTMLQPEELNALQCWAEQSYPEN